MAFIDDVDCEVIRTWLKHSASMKLVTSIDGKIHWANAAFCEAMGYSPSELLRLTSMQISVPGDDLQAESEAIKSLDLYQVCYTVRKQLIPKNDKPQWGEMSVQRYPPNPKEPIQYCLSVWQPLRNGTATAFTAAMEHQDITNKRLEAMNQILTTITNQSEEERYGLSTLRMIQKHPRLALAALMLALSSFGTTAVAKFMEVLQRSGAMALPPVPVKSATETGGEIGDTAAIQIVAASQVTYYESTLPNGTTIKWSNQDAGTNRGGRPMSVTAGRSSSGRSRIDGGLATVRGSSGGTGRVPDEQSAGWRASDGAYAGDSAREF